MAGMLEDWNLEDDEFGKTEVCVYKQRGWGDRMLRAPRVGLSFSLGDSVHLTVLLLGLRT